MTRLLSINNYYYQRGGAETVFFEHNRIFAGQGWDVVPFSMRHPNNVPTPWSRYFVDDLEIEGDYSLAQKLVRVPKVIYSTEARRRLSDLLRQAHPDIAHAHNIYHHISPSILGLLKARGIPTVITLHDLKIACPAYNMFAPDGICERCKGGRLYNVARNRCIRGSLPASLIVMAEAVVHRLLGTYRRHVDRLIVPSRFYIEKFAEWGMPASMFRHVPNFVAVESYTPRYEPGEAFLYFGRIIRQKGIATLIRAAAAARTKLFIAGTGPGLEDARALAAGLDAQVTFLGHIGGQRLHDVIRSCRAVVLPSEWYENAPVSLLEAYTLGKPVIGARIGGIPEMIRENITGTVFESGNCKALQAVLEDFASRPRAQIEDMGRAARRRVAEDFTVAMYRQRMMAVYRDLGVRVAAENTLTVEAAS